MGADLVPRTPSFFDERPIELVPSIRLHARRVEFIGRPKIKEWQRVLQFASETHEAAPYWIGELLLYADGRDDWREKLSQAISVTGKSRETLEGYQYLVKHVEEPERQLAPTPAHAREVATLERPEQTRFLTEARDESLTRHELRKRIKTYKRTRVIDAQATLSGLYRVIYADPPWSYRENTAWEDGSHTRAEDEYPVMNVEQLCQLPVAAHCMRDSVLFLWVPATMVFEHPGPRELAEAWGFTYKTGYVWDKVHGMPGTYSFVNHEHLFVFTRGAGSPDIAINGTEFDSVQVMRREGEHSSKPEHFRKIIEKLYPTGPYLELFGRRPIDGWTVFGNDPRLWMAEAAS